MNRQMLDLNDLAAGGNPGITAEKGSELAQAAAYCLEEEGHQQGAALSVRGDINRTYGLTWTPVTAQVRRTWHDDEEATEDGAACVAALLANLEIGKAVIIRARKSTPQQPTGFDYWLGDDNIADMSRAERTATESFSHLLADDSLVVRIRLEVSGIRKDSDTAIRGRATRKLRQMRRSDTLELPGYAIVVEFGQPVAEVRRK